MGLLDWLTDGTLTGSDLTGSGNGGGAAQDNPMLSQAPSIAPGTPGPGAPAPAPDPTPAAGPPDPPIDPSTQAIGGGTGAGPSPSVPLPAPRPPGADAVPTFAPNQTSSSPISPPAPAPLPPGGGVLTPADANGVAKSYEAAGGHAFAPPDAASSFGGQTALGRALGINPNSQSFKEAMGGLGAGLTAAGNSKGKSAGQAFAAGAGATLEGDNKEAHAQEKDAQAYLTAAIAAKRAGDNATYQTNYTNYLAAKLKSEQETAASKDATNKNDSPTQLYLSAQREVASDPLVKGALSAYQSALKTGTPQDIATAKSAYEQTVQERQAAHLAGVGLHPQTAAEIAKQPGNSQANPIDAGKLGITAQNIGKKLQPGQYYVNPADGKVYQFKGSSSKSSATPAASKPEPANPMKPDAVPGSDKDDE